MFGKHFESMYKGSMYGAGPVAFAVWGYVIATTWDSIVHLNPTEIAHTIGCSEKEVEAVIRKFCSPDPKSQNKEHQGRKLLKEKDEFKYYVTGWEYYRGLRNRAERAEYQKNWMRKKRAGLIPPRKKGGGSVRERQYVKAVVAGASEATLDQIAGNGEPDGYEEER